MSDSIKSVVVEACVDSVESARAAERAGARRIELCAALNDGGTTPSAGMIQAVTAAVELPVFVIARPRGGDFVYSDDEVAVIRRDVALARELGADGVVMGFLTPRGEIDVALTRAMREEASGMGVTFHRAFDATPDLAASLDALLSCGVDRVLTSGGAPTALEGVEHIAKLVTRAAGRLMVMAGGSISEINAREIVARSGVREIHVRAARVATPRSLRPASEMKLRKAFPSDERAWDETDEARFRATVAQLA